MSDYTDEIHGYLYEKTLKLSEITGHEFPDVDKIDFLNIIVNQYLFMTFRDDKPVGFLYATLFQSVFSKSIKIFMQQSLYAEPGSKAAYLLLKHFLDFGKLKADHVITMITPYTSIKGSSLEKLGFTEMETLYRWKNGRRR